jgi:DNA-directed RNA polymerase subunit RPC12/RpoP
MYMSYDDIYIEFKCDSCGTALEWDPQKVGQEVACPKCRDDVFVPALNGYEHRPHYVRVPEPKLPNLPQSIYIGPERTKRIKLTPRPVVVGWSVPEEIMPYSVRSVLIQLSKRKDFPCKYYVRVDGKDVWGNVKWFEGCKSSTSDEYHPCHLANGWMHGEESCKGWEYIANNLCQSRPEAVFLHSYLRLNKDRESPMPIPQAHVEVTEKVRPDFVMFIPITRFDWKWLAVEIDSKRYHQDEERDIKRRIWIRSEGYEVLRLSAKENMLEQVRKLYQKVCDIQNAGKRKSRYD